MESVFQGHILIQENMVLQEGGYKGSKENMPLYRVMEFLKMNSIGESMKIVSSSKEIIKNTIKIKTEKESSMSFVYRGYYGKVVFDYSFATVTIEVSKRMKDPITEDDIEFVKELNTYSYNDILHLDEKKKTVRASVITSLNEDFTSELFKNNLDKCCDSLKGFFLAM